jgi:phage regulator Rha-like protein
VGKFIPVEPEKWAEMVKAQAENARLEALTSEMDKTINASQAECRRLKAEVEELQRLLTAATFYKNGGQP